MIKIIIYYLLAPLICLILGWEIRKEKIYLSFAADEEKELENSFEGLARSRRDKIHEKHDDIIKSSYNRIKRLQVYLVIALLIIIPTWHIVTADLVHEMSHVEKVTPVGLGAGGALGEIDPVRYEIKPSYDIDSVKKQMKENANIYKPDIVFNVIDIDDLTTIPGKLGVYRMMNNRILVTYTYLSSYPIMKAFAIILTEDDPGQSYLAYEETFVYPDSPSSTSEFEEIS